MMKKIYKIWRKYVDNIMSMHYNITLTGKGQFEQ